MSRKFLAPIDLSNPKKIHKDFLVPISKDGKYELTGIKSKKVWSHGIVILTGERTSEHVFAKLVDNGHKFKVVEKSLFDIKIYLELIPKYKIGNVISINHNSANLDFKLDYVRLSKPIAVN